MRPWNFWYTFSTSSCQRRLTNGNVFRLHIFPGNLGSPKIPSPKMSKYSKYLAWHRRLFSPPNYYCFPTCKYLLLFRSFVLPFWLVVFRLFLESLSSLFFSLPCFPWWRILSVCSFGSVLHPTRPPCEPQVCVFPLRAVFLLVFLMLTYFTFLLFLPFFDFDLDIVCFIQPFSCGYYAGSSVSVSAATRLAYDMYLDTYVCWSHIFFWFGLRYTICFGHCVYYLLFITCFPLEWGNLPLQRYRSLSCDHRQHCSDDSCLLYTSPSPRD